jgi:para-nitrobenzyl esterase
MVTVPTTSGPVGGRTKGGVEQFFGLPFAAPPVGPLRFRPPAPPAPWTDVRDATRRGPFAPQLAAPLDEMLGARPPAWDEAGCLTLNVFTPATDDGRRPVMVWIHGGAFVNGAGSQPIYDGSPFVRHGDVVVVTINYRLGAFGFLHLDEIFGEAVHGSGVAGILDQIAALRWVRDNIAAFGGDPDQVTIFGESAGAMSIGTLLGMPGAEGLYHRAILQSGSASVAQRPATGTATARAVLDRAGIDTLAALEAAPAEDLLQAQRAVLAQRGRTALPFVPTIDGRHLPDFPLDTIAAGRTGAVPTLVGTTRDEMTLFLVLDPKLGVVDEARIAHRFEQAFGEGAAIALETYRANRPAADPTDLLVALTTDEVFRLPAIRLAEAQAAQGRAAFMYWFTWASPVMGGKLGSGHALELPFVWDALDRPGLGSLTGTGPERQAIADAMHRAWIAFARTGEPGWPEYDFERRATQRFDATREVIEDPLGDERVLWPR